MRSMSKVDNILLSAVKLNRWLEERGCPPPEKVKMEFKGLERSEVEMASVLHKALLFHPTKDVPEIWTSITLKNVEVHLATKEYVVRETWAEPKSKNPAIAK